MENPRFPRTLCKRYFPGISERSGAEQKRVWAFGSHLDWLKNNSVIPRAGLYTFGQNVDGFLCLLALIPYADLERRYYARAEWNRNRN